LSRLYTFRNNKEAETAVRGGLRMKQPDFYHAEISKLVLRWDKWMNVLGDGAEQYGYCSGANGKHLALLMADHLLIQSTVLSQCASYTIIIIISFMQGTYTYIPETNCVPTDIAILLLLFKVLTLLVSVLNL